MSEIKRPTVKYIESLANIMKSAGLVKIVVGDITLEVDPSADLKRSLAALNETDLDDIVPIPGVDMYRYASLHTPEYGKKGNDYGGGSKPLSPQPVTPRNYRDIQVEEGDEPFFPSDISELEETYE